MQTIKLTTHIGSDGLLKVEIPVEMANVDADVVIIYTLQSKTESVDDDEWQSFVDDVLGDDDATEPSKPPFDLRDYTP
ncbi:MAG: hypothetical protein ABI690_30240 [Chloroflexota bacterium]